MKSSLVREPPGLGIWTPGGRCDPPLWSAHRCQRKHRSIDDSLPTRGLCRMGSRLQANSTAVRKTIEKHKFEDEEGEEYEPSKFGGFTDYFRRKKIKLQNLDAEKRSLGSKPPIFRGVVAHVNGYTQPSLNDLHGLIVEYGGGFMQYLDGKTTVTHIIASNLTPKKKVEFSRYRIVKPAWVVDSIEAGKLLPWDTYRLVDEGVGQRVLGFENGNITSQANSLYKGYKDQTETSWYTSQVKGVADELNARGPEMPFPSTQVPAIDEIESDFDEVLGLSEMGELSASEKSQHVAGKGEPRSLDPDQIDGVIRDDLAAQQDRAKELGASIDAEVVPAADASFTESHLNTQEQRLPPSAEPGNEDQEEKPAPQPSLSEQLLVEGETDRPVEDLGEDKAKHLFTFENASKGAGQRDMSEPHARYDGSRRPEDMTAEEHNAVLLADPKVWKSTVVNPGFLKQYYEESRLHHLSAWKAQLKTQIQAIAAEKSSSQRTREKRAQGARRYILHVDFDCFFAAVSLKRHPELVDKPVVVAHGGGSGAEIASCNYPARRFGIKNGMWMKYAQKMCPGIKVLPYDFKAYEEASRHFYEAIIDTGGLVQSVSIDEALVDVSMQCIAAGGHDGKVVHEGSIWREQGTADEIAQGVRDRVKEMTDCAVSVGIGGNILLAKVALRKAKPAGQHHIKPEHALDFLGGLSMRDLPGIAHSIGGKLEEIGVKYVKDVRQLSKERIVSALGPKTGEKVWDYSRGIDRAEVGDQIIRKSVSAEVNWGIRFVTQDQAEEFIQSLCDELHKRLMNEGVKGRQLTMKLMRRAADAPLDPPKHLGHGKCDTFNKSIVLGVPTNDASVMGREAISILRGWGFSPGELRGIGCQMQRLEPLKGVVDGLNDSSQKRLQFKTSTAPKPKPSLPLDDTIIDDIESPQKPKVQPPPHLAAVFAKDATPGSKPRAPLNTMGTQFVLPTQVDPETLAELPSDIRRMLFPYKKEPTPDAAARSRSQTPNPYQPADILPSHSQIDPETLKALPEDVRAEILAHYHQSSKKSHNQGLLPQSPRKDRTIKLPKKLTTPTKKARPFGAGNKVSSNSAFSTLTQSNFVAANGKATDSETDAIPDDFLSALPPDIRREVLAQQRRDRLQKTGSLNLPTTKRKQPRRSPQPSPGQRLLHLPPRPSKPSFTSKKITALPELREAISAWYEEFKEEGPYAEDVGALVGYLERVVGEEGDMGKAVAIAKWLKWVVDAGSEEGRGGEEEQVSWATAVESVQDGVQRAVIARGLGSVAF